MCSLYMCVECERVCVSHMCAESPWFHPYRISGQQAVVGAIREKSGRVSPPLSLLPRTSNCPLPSGLPQLPPPWLPCFCPFPDPVVRSPFSVLGQGDPIRT